MTIITKYGDMLDEKNYSPNDLNILVHGCNKQGVMGTGIAKQIKDKWPGAYEAYKDVELNNGLLLGDIIFYLTEDHLSGIVIINAITQEYYGRSTSKVYVSYDAIRSSFVGISALLESIDSNVIINFPLIGCGLTNGDWNIVSKIIDEEIDDKFGKVLWKLPQ